LQTLMLDALAELGPMTGHQLQTACLIEPRQRGGFQSTLVRMFDRGWVEQDDFNIRLSRAGSAARASIT
jgi:hypothetical protein